MTYRILTLTKHLGIFPLFLVDPSCFLLLIHQSTSTSTSTSLPPPLPLTLFPRPSLANVCARSQPSPTLIPTATAYPTPTRSTQPRSDSPTTSSCHHSTTWRHFTSSYLLSPLSFSYPCPSSLSLVHTNPHAPTDRQPPSSDQPVPQRRECSSDRLQRRRDAVKDVDEPPGPGAEGGGNPGGRGRRGCEEGDDGGCQGWGRSGRLGGVVGNRVKEEEVMDRKPCESARNLCHTDADKDGGRGRRAHQEW